MGGDLQLPHLKREPPSEGQDGIGQARRLRGLQEYGWQDTVTERRHWDKDVAPLSLSHFPTRVILDL